MVAPRPATGLTWQQTVITSPGISWFSNEYRRKRRRKAELKRPVRQIRTCIQVKCSTCNNCRSTTFPSRSKATSSTEFETLKRSSKNRASGGCKPTGSSVLVNLIFQRRSSETNKCSSNKRSASALNRAGVSDTNAQNLVLYSCSARVTLCISTDGRKVRGRSKRSRAILNKTPDNGWRVTPDQSNRWIMSRVNCAVVSQSLYQFMLVTCMANARNSVSETDLSVLGLRVAV
jgi:hypothetical protein